MKLKYTKKEIEQSLNIILRKQWQNNNISVAEKKKSYILDGSGVDVVITLSIILKAFIFIFSTFIYPFSHHQVDYLPHFPFQNDSSPILQKKDIPMTHLESNYVIIPGYKNI